MHYASILGLPVVENSMNSSEIKEIICHWNIILELMYLPGGSVVVGKLATVYLAPAWKILWQINLWFPTDKNSIECPIISIKPCLPHGLFYTHRRESEREYSIAWIFHAHWGFSDLSWNILSSHLRIHFKKNKQVSHLHAWIWKKSDMKGTGWITTPTASRKAELDLK